MKRIVLYALLAGCKATGGNGSSEAQSVQPGEPTEPIIVCAARDVPRMEVEIFPTGFDPQQGMTVEVVIRGAAPGEQVLTGRGQVSDDSLEMLLDRGRLTAEARPAQAGTRGAPAYDGEMELDDSAPRAVHCL